jgi:phosphate transport system ATP-binding protein
VPQAQHRPDAGRENGGQAPGNRFFTVRSPCERSAADTRDCDTPRVSDVPLRTVHVGSDAGEGSAPRAAVFEVRGLTIRYHGVAAVRDVSFDVREREVTAFIGPSGCGKTTILRTLNRMNDLVPSATVEGSVLFHGADLYAPEVDPVEVRRRIGMVFQKPNPFPRSIRDNVAFGPRSIGLTDGLNERIERALRQAALWDEVKDRLGRNAWSLSGGQQQRLCIARCLAVEPEVLLMDEPASALDPISSGRIEDLIHELKRDYAIVIITHNMQQAARVAARTAFFSVDAPEHENDHPYGVLVEIGETRRIFTSPRDPRTEAYVTGRFG